MNFRFHLRLTNRLSKDVQLVLEPWGMIYELPSQTSAEIVFDVLEEEGLDAPEIVWAEDSITAYCGRAGGAVEVVPQLVTVSNGRHPIAAKAV